MEVNGFPLPSKRSGASFYLVGKRVRAQSNPHVPGSKLNWLQQDLLRSWPAWDWALMKTKDIWQALQHPAQGSGRTVFERGGLYKSVHLLNQSSVNRPHRFCSSNAKFSRRKLPQSLWINHSWEGKHFIRKSPILLMAAFRHLRLKRQKVNLFQSSSSWHNSGGMHFYWRPITQVISMFTPKWDQWD